MTEYMFTITSDYNHVLYIQKEILIYILPVFLGKIKFVHPTGPYLIVVH